MLAVATFAAAANGQDITTGLTGHWRLTETSGTTAVDSSSAPHNGTYTGGVALASSTAVPVDGAIAANFDGVDDYVAIPNESTFDYVGAMTVSAWIKVDVFDVAEQAIAGKGDTAWRLQRDASNNGVAFSCRGLTTNRIASTVSVNDGKWHLVTGVYTSGQLRIYVDGVLNNSVNSVGFISTNNFAVEIARNAEIAGREFDGAIYDVRVYNRALTGIDISYLYLLGGPVGHWKLDATSGTTAVDSSPYGSNGALTGAANWSYRCGGTATFDFTGTTQYFTIPNASHLQPTTALTIAGWIRGDSWSSADVVNAVLRKGDNNPNNYQLCVANGRLSLSLQDNDPPAIQGNTLLKTGEWYHVAATWDGSTARLYLNGQLDNTPAARSGAIPSDTRALYIGGRPSTDYVDGMLYDVRLYNRALTQAEIAKLAGLVGHWNFAEGTGTAAADSSGLANNATLSGGATWLTDCAGNKALQTNGAGGIAQTASAFTPPSIGTVAFWMQGAGSRAARGRVLGISENWEVRQETTGAVSFDLGGSPYVGNEPFSTLTRVDTAGRWYHIVAVFSDVDNSFAVYVDGELRSSGISPVDLVPQSQGILSAGTRTGNTEYWAGALRDLRIYNRKLCPAEIAELYGLLLHWRLDETSGITAADSSAHGRIGTVLGSASWTAGTIGNALQLNGATSVEVTSLLGSPKNVTLSAWAKLTAADSGGAEVLSLADYFAIRLQQATPTRAFFYNGSTWVSVAATQPAGIGWHHYAAVFDDNQNTCKFYVDGAEAGSVATAVTLSYTGLGTKTVVGKHGNGTTTLDFTGLVDDVRVYNRALCPTEVQTLTDGGEPFDGVRILKWVEIQ
jgi:Concanavalin A-like lectin/glucanases superfamily